MILLETLVRAPRERVFDLARCLELHLVSTSRTGERVVAGRAAGLIEEGEEVTWEARHLGVKQRLRVRITRMERPGFFEDEMVAGAFESMRHEHHFEEGEQETLMKDVFEFRAPCGVLGRVAERGFLEGYLGRFLAERNRVLKEVAEGEAWRQYLG